MKWKWRESIDPHVIVVGLIVFGLLLLSMSVARRPFWLTSPLWVALVQELFVLPMILTKFFDLREVDREDSRGYLFFNLLFVQVLAALAAAYSLRQ